MARLTKQQLRVMEQQNKRNTRIAAGGMLALVSILVGAVWWLFVTLPIRFSVWLTRTFGWRGWLVFGVVVVALAVVGHFTGSH